MSDSTAADTSEEDSAMTAPQPVTSLRKSLSAGMDRPLEKRGRPLAKWGLILLAGILATYGIWRFVDGSGVRSFSVDPARVSIATVESGTFLDFIPIRGNVTPLDTVYLDAIEGGRVERIFVEEGSLVEQGEPIVELSNTALQLDVISREAQVSEQLNNLRNTRLAMEQNRLSLKSDLVEIDYQIRRLGRLTERRKDLFERGLIASQDYEDAQDEYEYFRNRREVTIESQEQDNRLREAQISSLEDGIEQLEKNLVIARKNLQSLTITAPMSGQLTSLNADIGESKSRGQRLGQVDDVDRFKITAQVDEFYVTRLQSGQRAEFDLSGESFALEVTKVYPEVRNGQFEVDLAFAGTPPANIRRGQTLQIRVRLGDSREALLLRRGGFYQDTGGNWAFVLQADGAAAVRRSIRLGRRNPQNFEVLEGLSEGDRVIVSEYSSYADMDRIEFKN